MSQRKKFAIHAGRVRSKTDGDVHHVSAPDLIRLYELQPGEYVIWDERFARGRNWDDYRHLSPRHDGQYGRPAE